MKTFRTTFSPRSRSRKDERSFGMRERFASHRLVNHDSDRNGNMTWIPNLNLMYDAWNRLVRVTSPDGTLVAEYRYDALNRRVTKTTSTETRRFYYNRNWQCIQEVVENQPTIHYVWGLRYIDDLVCRIVGLDCLYPLPDPNWNVVALVDTTATPVERYTYNAFGKLHIYDGNFTPRNTSNYAWTRTFTGQVPDAETNLLLYRNRFYHPDLGRFLTRDPIGYIGDDKNLYRYVINGVLVNTDSSGFVTMTLTGCGIGAIGGGIGGGMVAVMQGDSVGRGACCGAVGGCVMGAITAGFTEYLPRLFLEGVLAVELVAWQRHGAQKVLSPYVT